MLLLPPTILLLFCGSLVLVISWYVYLKSKIEIKTNRNFLYRLLIINYCAGEIVTRSCCLKTRFSKIFR